MNLDLLTIFILIALVSLMMSLTMFFTAYSYPYKKNSMRIWAIGSILRAFFWAMLAFRGLLPEFFSIVVANAGVIVCELIFIKAFRILQDKDIENRWLYLSSGVSILALSFFTYIVPSLFWRIEFISLASLVVGVAGIYTLLFSKRESRNGIDIFCGVLFIISAIAVIIRGGYVAYIYPEQSSLFMGGLVQNISFAVIFVCIVIITFVYMMMVNLKFNNELRTALSEVKTLKSMLPICSYCRNIRDDDNNWQKLETYLQKHTEFSHGVCPTCYENEVVPQLEAFKSQFQN